MTAREIIEAEDPKQFMMGGREARKLGLLTSFCDSVYNLLEVTDDGNAEVSPGEPNRGGWREPSRWDFLWKQLELVKQEYGIK